MGPVQDDMSVVSSDDGLMSQEPSPPSPAGPWDAWKLFFLGFLTLFLELVLIRYLAGSIWNLGYFPNLVLLAVFVGMGFGFLLHHLIPARRSSQLFHGSLFVLLLLVVFVRYMSPTLPGFGQVFGEIGGELYFTLSPVEEGTESFLMFEVWFAAIVCVFAFLSQRTAKLFRLFQPLRAYTLDISGSCCGVLCFMLMSWAHVPAYIWFLISLLLFAAAMEKCSWMLRLLPALPFAAIVILVHGQDSTLMAGAAYEGEMAVHWSPYQRVTYVDNPVSKAQRFIRVNGIHHQSLLTREQILNSYYQGPHAARKKQGLEPYRRVLIIGAGAGNDTVAALANGAEQVDAVEIDPVIAELGRRHHPEDPYADPRVTVTIDDGRAFMTRTDRRYDLVIFAQTDSLVKVSSMAQLRLENYLFTEESIRRAYSLLGDGGDLAFYNGYRRWWLVEKYQRLIHAATGRYPRIIHKFETTVTLVVGRESPAEAAPAFLESENDIPTDDWPFPYLQTRGMPLLYLLAITGAGIFVLAMAIFLHRLEGRRRLKEGVRLGLAVKLAFVFMGIAFLLLETKSIVQFSLLFGTTWVNTSLVFLAVLLLVLAANWCALLLRQRWVLPLVYLLLLASCLVTFAYPVAGLLGLESGALKFILASLLTFSPIFFANLVFSVTFRDQLVPEHLFGWNLLGGSVGGLLEYSSMAIGYNALAVIVAVCYTLVVALLLRGSKHSRHSRVAGGPP